MDKYHRDFDDIVLSRAEKDSIGILKLLKEQHRDKIKCFDSLDRYGFLDTAHPESREADGYGGFTTDEFYCLSETYFLYEKHKRNSFLKIIFRIIELLKP